MIQSRLCSLARKTEKLQVSKYSFTKKGKKKKSKTSKEWKDEKFNKNKLIRFKLNQNTENDYRDFYVYRKSAFIAFIVLGIWKKHQLTFHV